MIIWSDGSGWNGQSSRTAVEREDGKHLFLSFDHQLSNNDMEALGVLLAAILAQPGDLICSDSQLIVNQVNGLYKCKAGNLKPYVAAIQAMISEKGVKVEWRRREGNKADKYFRGGKGWT